MSEGERGLWVKCDNGHAQKLLLPHHSQAEAEMLGGIMDGTSPIYKYPPREYPPSVIGKCSMPDCDAYFKCELFGDWPAPAPGQAEGKETT